MYTLCSLSKVYLAAVVSRDGFYDFWATIPIEDVSSLCAIFRRCTLLSTSVTLCLKI